MEARPLHKPYPAWLGSEELIPPKTLILILWCCQWICRAPTAKPPAGLWEAGLCVYKRAPSGDSSNCTHRIREGTQLS